ncbi:MAG TPA: hypothetical protein VGQ81_06510, partial [Acidobacteriota bacterium]|nr:hypothetical protein [Acidobacteriota bacterium]
TAAQSCCNNDAGRSDFASLIAMTHSGAPLPSGRGSVGAASKPAAADHAPFLRWLASFVWLWPYGHFVHVIVVGFALGCSLRC